MAPLTDPERLFAYTDALKNWSYSGYVRFELTDHAYEWLRRELNGLLPRELSRLMHEYVSLGGEIDEVAETRPQWSGSYPYHYDLRLSIEGKPVYIESRLHYCRPVLPDESWIKVVNIHAP